MIPIRDHIPTRRIPIVTIVLIALNVLMFMMELSLQAAGGTEALNALTYRWGVVAYRITHAFSVTAFLTLLTSQFLHGGFMHLIGNMLYLWIFGNNVEDAVGRGRFIFFYLLCGVLAALAQVLADTDAQVPAIGASGAIAGVLGGYILLFPHARVDTLIAMGYFVRLRPMPAYLVIGLWFVLQLFNGVLSLGVGQMGGVAWFAHIGGFLAGLLLIKIFVPRRPRGRGVGPMYDWW